MFTLQTLSIHNNLCPQLPFLPTIFDHLTSRRIKPNDCKSFLKHCISRRDKWVVVILKLSLGGLPPDDKQEFKNYVKEMVLT